ncbi:HamA C-terminal domain-containing protein [Flavobacterium sp.]|uniref:HamA C-terminal domain-containing protein n=1 Tax=Flavobacterium sp. TaxID=239 RepID=UPI003D098EC5
MTKKISDINWEKLLKVNRDFFFDLFILNEEVAISDEVKIKFYSLKYNDNGLDDSDFINHLYEAAAHYVFDEKDIKELIEDGYTPTDKALSYFGDIDPLTDGRYGELILYLFIEAVLQAPMIVHKISQTYNNNDQVKGSDGIFIGNINGQATLLLGESKMKNNFYGCAGEALDSLKRYINNPQSIDRELEVAKKHLSRDLNNLDENDLDLIYQSLRTKQIEFQEYKICYPAFLMYKEGKIKEIISQNILEIEKQVLIFLKSMIKRRSNYIKASLSEINNITFEFFMMPVDDVSSFREECYAVFHNGKKFERKE